MILEFRVGGYTVNKFNIKERENAFDIIKYIRGKGDINSQTATDYDLVKRQISTQMLNLCQII